MSDTAEKDAGLTRRPGESQTAFTIRCVQAEAWDAGHDRVCARPAELCGIHGNPYRVLPPGGDQ